MNTDQDPGTASGSRARLRLEISGAEPVFIALARGRNTVGRSEANDIALDDSTVSEEHCVIEIADDDAVVTELGSTNGTFVDGEPVSQAARLRPGQKLQVGQVELTFELSPEQTTSAPQAPLEDGTGPLPMESTRRQCARHPEARATWECTDCSKLLCAACVKQVRLEGSGTVTICPFCQGLCERVAQRSQAAPERTGLLSGLVGALGYPLKGNGLFMLLAAALIYWVLALPGAAASKAASPMMQRVTPLNVGMSATVYGSFLIGLAVGVYVLVFLRGIVLASAEGQEAVPGWPELDQDHLREAAAQFLATYFISFGVWTLCRIWFHPETEAGRLALQALLVAGSLYFPMALLAVIIYDNLAALNPLLVFLSILKVPLSYGTTCLFLGALAGGNWLLEMALNRMGFPLLSSAMTGFTTLYAAMAAMRMIGWFYFCTHDELDWS